MKKRYNHLSYEERIMIRSYVQVGLSLRKISKELGRAPSTISRELSRNEQFSGKRVIYPRFAQMKANGRRRRAYKKERLKSINNQKYVEDQLKMGWSPEQISGRMHVEQFSLPVSHEAIYQWIYSCRRDLAVYLTRHHRQRKRFGQSKKFKKIAIPNRIAISERPKVVERRKEIGHWETDLVVSKQNKDSILVSVERKTRYVKLSKLKDRKSITASNALVQDLLKFIGQYCKTITYDNGKENVRHQDVNRKLGCKSYFCDPNQSQQKGSVENVAGLVRRIFPKKTDFANVHHSTIKALENKLNNRPRKCLGFKTPIEALLDAGVALQC